MGKLNTTLSCLIVLLAIVAGVFSFLLFERRNEFRGRSEQMAATVSAITEVFDRDSSTTVARQATFTAADPVRATVESGTLSWQAYRDAKGLDQTYTAYKRTLDQVIKHVADFHAQRNKLAATLADISLISGYPEERLIPLHLQNLRDAAVQDQAMANLIEHAQKVSNRNQAIIDSLVSLSEVFGSRLDRERFVRRETDIGANNAVQLGAYAVANGLGDLNTAAAAWNTRSRNLGEILADATNQISKHTWSTHPRNINDPRQYQAALATLRNDFTAINDKLLLLEKTQHDLKKTRSDLEETSAALDASQRLFARLETELMRENIEINRLTRIVTVLEGRNREIVGDRQMGISRRDVLEGKVLQVNERWNFVILNLGRGDIKDGTQMLIARGNEFVAKVEISQVLESISVAEILDGLVAVPIQAGDRVILPNQD